MQCMGDAHIRRKKGSCAREQGAKKDDKTG